MATQFINPNPDTSHQVVQRNVYQPNFPDRWTAIKHIESRLPEFFIDSSVKLSDGLFAHNLQDDELDLQNDFLRLKVNNSITYFHFDIPESHFIHTLKSVTLDAISHVKDITAFNVIGISGTVYSFDESDFELLDFQFPIVESNAKIVTDPLPIFDFSPDSDFKLSDFIITQRRLAQNEVLSYATGGSVIIKSA